MKGLRTLIDRFSIQYILMSISIFLSLLTLGLFFWVSESVLSSSLHEQYRNYTYSWLKKSDDYFRSILVNNYRVVRKIFLDPRIQKAFSFHTPIDDPDTSYDFVRNINSVMNDLFYQFEYIDDCFFIDADHNWVFQYSRNVLNGTFLPFDQQIDQLISGTYPEDEPFLFTGVSGAGDLPESEGLLTPYRNFYLSISPCMTGNDEVAGYLVLVINSSVFSDFFNRMVTDTDIVILRHPGTDIEEGMITAKLSSFPVQVFVQSDDPEVAQGRITKLLVLMLLLCLLLSFLLSLILSRWTVRPLKEFIHEMKNDQCAVAHRYRLSLYPVFFSIMGYFIGSFLLPCIIFGITALNIQHKGYMDRITDYSRRSLQGVQFTVDHSFQVFRDHISEFLYSDTVQKAFNGKKDLRIADQEQVRIASNNLGFVNLYNESGRLFFSTETLDRDSFFTLTDNSSKVVSNKRFGLMYLGRIPNYYYNDVFIFGQRVHLLKTPRVVVGYANVFLPKEMIDSALMNVYLDDSGTFFLVDEFGNPISIHEKASPNPNLKELSGILKSSDSMNRSAKIQRFVFDGKSFLLFSAPIHDFGFSMLFVISESAFKRGISPILSLEPIILVISFVFLTIIAFFLSYTVVSPIRKLVAQVAGNETIQNLYLDELNTEYTGANEIKILTYQFERINSKLLCLAEENHEVRIREKELIILEHEARLMALQQQINPHFLYNTLETIKWTAFRKKDFDVVNMVTALGDIFRGSITHDLELMKVKENLVFIEKYLYIQKLRYGERFSFRMELGKDVSDIKIPQFIIQPLVENAIDHGMAMVESGGEIILSICRAGNCIRIEVCDNGSGINYDDLSQIRKELSSGGNSVGLLNVYNRLRLQYGEDFQFTLNSAPGKGTVVILEFPSS